MHTKKSKDAGITKQSKDEQHEDHNSQASSAFRSSRPVVLVLWVLLLRREGEREERKLGRGSNHKQRSTALAAAYELH